MEKLILKNVQVWDIIEFGYYPQSVVSDEEIINVLIEKCGKPKLACNSSWKDYEYLVGKGMYADIIYLDKRYRLVYMQKHRESDFIYKDTSYFDNKIYAFIFEPILWRVLNIVDNKALLVSQKLIDEQEFFVGRRRRKDKKTIYMNNYEYSHIRSWLNNNFYETAFNESEKSIILTTEVCNNSYTTKNENNCYVCNDTLDKVFLLSFNEAKTLFANNKDRWKKATEYTKSQGCFAYKTPDAKYNNAGWWLRSPDHKYENCVRCVGYGGGLGDGGFSCSNEPANTLASIAPAIYIQLSDI
jgi:hypothetical protein